PIVPKRVFLPVTLFSPLAVCVVLPFSIYFYSRLQQLSWCISLCQVLVGMGILYWVKGGFSLRWPLVEQKWIEGKAFSWLNLLAFLLANALVLLPAVVIYLFVCAGLAADRFTEGFLSLRAGGLTVEVRTYARNDGKRIQLVPMAHVGDADFYRKL